MTNAELRRLEADRATAPETWRAVVAEIARRDASGATPALRPDVPTSRVVLAGVDIPFWHLVRLFVKASFASLPAVIIVTAIIWLSVAFLIGIGASLH